MKKPFIIIAAMLVLLKISTSFADQEKTLSDALKKGPVKFEQVKIAVNKPKSKNESKKRRNISVKPADKVVQGGTVFIEVETPEELKNPVFTYKGRTYRLFSRGDKKYAGYLGIGALEKPGKYAVSMSDETGNLNDETHINIVSKDFPNQYLTVTKGMAGLRATNHELRQIGRMKRTLSEDFLGSMPPYNSPAQGCINSIFGVKRYYNGQFSGNYHKGIDIKADKGTPVNSITAGKVIFADMFRLHGGSVAVDHGNGVVSLYIHLSKIDVKAGDMVAAGQKVGEVGATGFATGPHLHWGLYVNGTAVDPMTDWIKPAKICM